MKSEELQSISKKFIEQSQSVTGDVSLWLAGLGLLAEIAYQLCIKNERGR